MYFGSVRFFKHVITGVVVLIIIALTVTSIKMAIVNKQYKLKLQALETTNMQLTEKTQLHYPNGDPLEYQTLYPELYVENRPTGNWVQGKKTVYLTFDDGPSERTVEILDLLKDQNIKATFFVVGKTGEREKQIMRRIVEEGHTIAVHTFSHEYSEVYQSVEAYLTDFAKVYQLIYENTGVKPELFRFPGGSINTYNLAVHKEISSEMLRRGFLYYDWNASTEDAAAGESKYSVYTNAVHSAANRDKVILLMHDSSDKYNTVETLPQIINKFRNDGYKFDKLTKDVKPVVFDYNE